MKKKVGVLAVASALCATFVLASCGSTEQLAFSEVYKADEVAQQVTAATKIAGDGYVLSESSGPLVEFLKYEGEGLERHLVSTKIYNLNLDKFVVDDASAETYNIGSQWITYSKADTTYYLDFEGTQLLTTDDDAEEEPVSFSASGTLWGYSVYAGKLLKRDSEKGTVVIGDTTMSDLAQFPSISRATDLYHYQGKDDRVIIYDQSFNVKATYMPEYNDYFTYYVLANGNLLVQRMKYEEDNAKKYDVLVQNEMSGGYTAGVSKMSLVTEIFDVEKGRTKEIDFDYSIASVSNKLTSTTFEDEYQDTVENVIKVAPIVDKRVDTRDCATMWLSMNNDVEFVGRIDGQVENQVGKATQIPGTKYFTVNDAAGRKMLVNEAGAVIGDITFAYDKVANATPRRYTSEYFVFNNKIYSFADLKVVLDLGEDEHDKGVIQCVNDKLVLYKSTRISNGSGFIDGYAYYIFNGKKDFGDMIHITTSEYNTPMAAISNKYFMETSGTAESGFTYTYKNMNGTAITGMPNVKIDSPTYTCYLENGGTAYVMAATEVVGTGTTVNYYVIK